MCVGLVKKNKIFYSKAKGIGNPIIYVGSKTGRDGIHGRQWHQLNLMILQLIKDLKFK